MRRVAVALIAPIAVAVAVAGCGGSPSTTTSSNANSAVTIEGAAGKAPVVTIPASKASSKLVTKTVTTGTGPALASTDSILANFSVYKWRGKTHTLLFSSYKTSPEVLPLTGLGLTGLQTALSGQRIGARVLAVLPPKYGYGAAGNSQLGVAPTDTLVWVVDIIKAFAPTESATGKNISSGGGTLPTVTATAGASPTITIPKKSPPNKLVVKTLIKGTGAPLKAHEAIVVRYVGSIWRTGKVFNNNWPTAQSPSTPPNLFVLGQLIPAWNNGLVGVPVGSRVMLVVPPTDGYGKTGQASAGIKGTDTLVFVIDILSTAT